MTFEKTNDAIKHAMSRRSTLELLMNLLAPHKRIQNGTKTLFATAIINIVKNSPVLDLANRHAQKDSV
jgi:hypothetical protein